ncbi:MAG: LCP family protein [Elusimicrobiota bacterium]
MKIGTLLGPLRSQPARAMRAVALAGAGLTVLCAVAVQRSPVAAALREGRPLAGILLGTDQVESIRHSDTLMVWHYDPVRRQLDLLSIPRDIRITLPGYRFNRINEVFAYHYKMSRDAHRASREVMAAVDEFLSGPEASFRSDYYVHVDYDGFRRLVDLLGGVRVRVDEPMHYDDNAGNLHIHREPGEYLMNGSDALDYARFRGRSGDRGRILRQMEFLRSLAARLSNPVLLLRGPGLLRAASSGLHTNLSAADAAALVLEARHVPPEKLQPRLLPGRAAGPYWERDSERTALALRQMKGEAAPTVSSEVLSDVGATTVKVWNGTGRPGLALEVTRRLRAAGFDVLEWGNYEARQTRTRVLDRSGDFAKAQAVARALGEGTVFSEVHPKLRADVEVVLGEDYKSIEN